MDESRWPITSLAWYIVNYLLVKKSTKPEREAMADAVHELVVSVHRLLESFGLDTATANPVSPLGRVRKALWKVEHWTEVPPEES